MRLGIRKIRPATAQEWDDAYATCAYATYFHSRDWSETGLRYAPSHLSPAALKVEFDDGLWAVIPMTAQTRLRGLERTYLSSPAGTYGGWISGDALGQPHWTLLRDVMLRRIGKLAWRVNPFDPSSASMPVPVDAVADETHVLNLEAGWETVRASWPSKQNWSLNRARREGITVRQGSAREDWRAYFELYEQSLQRWGSKATSRYEWRVFENIWERRDENVVLWLAERQGRPVAGAIMCNDPNHVCYWHGAADREAFKLQPVNLLIAAVIEDACKRGVKWFDFLPSGGISGVAQFKKSFAAEARACPLIRVNTAWSSLLERTRDVVRRRTRSATTPRALVRG